jgi:hypothetical protein
MMKISTTIGAGLLTLATTIQPAEAIPMQPISDALISTDNVTAVYFRRGSYAAGGFYYYNGYRGVFGFRPGYRYYNGYWFPATAFAAGVAAGAIATSPPPSKRGRLAAAHVQWCYDHYVSYREWDNSYQPYVGPRRTCLSPYH